MKSCCQPYPKPSFLFIFAKKKIRRESLRFIWISSLKGDCEGAKQLNPRGKGVNHLLTHPFLWLLLIQWHRGTGDPPSLSLCSRTQYGLICPFSKESPLRRRRRTVPLGRLDTQEPIPEMQESHPVQVGINKWLLQERKSLRRSCQEQALPSKQPAAQSGSLIFLRCCGRGCISQLFTKFPV